MTSVVDAPREATGTVLVPEPLPTPGTGRFQLARPRRPHLSLATITGITAALLALWFLFFALVLSGVQESRSQQQLYATLRQGLASTNTPIGGVIAAGTPVALISAPSIGLKDDVVSEGTDSTTLTTGPGHRPDTPLPGQPGVAVIYGRSATFGGPFRKLPQLHAGAPVTVSTGQGVFHFVVTAVRRAGDPLPAPLAAGAGELTLVTSEGTGLRSVWAPDHVVYVDARLKGSTQPAPSARVSQVPPEEKAMAVTTVPLTRLVLWMQALFLSALASEWARRKWGRPQVYLVGVPVLLACLWGATEVAVQLLPNLI